MSVTVPEEQLPVELTAFAAVETAYAQELSRVTDALRRGLSSLVEADKELTPFVFKSVRDRLKKEGKQFLYLDGRPVADLPPLPQAMGLVASILFLLREAVRGAVADRIIVLRTSTC